MGSLAPTQNTAISRNLNDSETTDRRRDELELAPQGLTPLTHSLKRNRKEQ